MPTYEYKCSACGFEFEKFQSMSAAPEKKCPNCGKNKAQRLISAGAGLIFKGSGFYITDYRDQGYKEKAKADAAPSSGESSTSGDSKPAESKPAESKPAATESKPAAASSSKSESKSTGKSGKSSKK